MSVFAEEPIAISNSQEDQVEELHRLIKLGGATLTSPDGLHRLELPENLYRLLLRIIKNLAEGKPVALTPGTQELGTQEAANLLGMSRQFLITLLNQNEIPYYKVGTHRRLRMADVMAYRKQRDKLRHDAIGGIAQEAVDAGAYDDF